MPKDDDLRDFLTVRLGEMHGDIREIAANQRNHKEYLDAVSIKAGRAYERAEGAEKTADAAMDTHKADLLAHGAGATVKVIGAATAMCAGLVAAWRAIRP